eukprot:9130481-Pyramimonas_sp.AAC.1
MQHTSCTLLRSRLRFRLNADRLSSNTRPKKRGFCSIDDPGPCLALLRDIGLDVEDPPTPPEPAVAQPPAARPLSEEDAAYLATHPKATGAAPWVVERFRRQAAQGGQAAA